MSLIDHTFKLAKNAASLGLNCTADGASLAGVPLLRMTPAGLAPRPAHEIDALMKGAYGRDIDPAEVMPGLDVIAKALNGGDLGRAMVAAVRLKLPDVSREGATYIAYTDQVLAKYDADEPRDERGRWTTGGSSSSDTSSEAMKPILIADRPAANDNHPMGGHPKLRTWDPSLISDAMTYDCVNHAQAPGPHDKMDYQGKIEECQAANEKCQGLIQLGEENLFRTDECHWPDGSIAKIKAGMVLPIWFGHKF